jgi:chromosomal replication initiator protein
MENNTTNKHTEVKMNEIILNAIDSIEKQLAHLRQLVVNQPEEMKSIQETKVIDDIISDACLNLMNVKYSEIQSRTRRRDVVDARAIVIAFNYFTNNKKTLRDIGAPVGVDHSTVLHSLKKFCDLYKIDGQWRFIVNDFFDAFENNGYNCEQTKQYLTDGHQYFNMRGTLTKRESEPVGKSTNKIERMSFHCAIT